MKQYFLYIKKYSFIFCELFFERAYCGFKQITIKIVFKFDQAPILVNEGVLKLKKVTYGQEKKIISKSTTIQIRKYHPYLEDPFSL